MQFKVLSLKDINEEQLTKALNELPEWRREKTLRYRFVQGRKESTFAYLLLCEMLNDYYSIKEPPVFTYNEHGKPSLKDHSDVYFSISHCKDAVACAVDSKPIGIDIELLGRYSEQVARYCMSDSEMQTILSAEDADMAFTRLWTMKEAYLKLTGEGVSSDMGEVLNKAKMEKVTIRTFSMYDNNDVKNLPDSCVLSVAYF